MLRPSIGSAVLLGLRKQRMLASPTTVYVMLGEHCISHCAFCRQRAGSTDYLARVNWVPVEEDKFLKALEESREKYLRVCFQTLDYPGLVDDLVYIVPKVKEAAKKPVSVSIVPVSDEEMRDLREAGVDTLSIAIDGAGRDTFEKWKGAGVKNRFRWDTHWDALRRATEVFPAVSTHLIVGLGESDRDLVDAFFRCRDMGVSAALFAYTEGNVPYERYRTVQLVQHLVFSGALEKGDVEYRDGKIVNIKASIPDEVFEGVPFMTSGCPGCNRPFYNERPGGELYNYPYKPEKASVEKIIGEIKKYTGVPL